MLIQNANIKDVTVLLNSRQKLCIRLSFERYSYDFILYNNADLERITKLLLFTQSKNLKDLKGKTIREVILGNFLQAFGHPTEDKFLPIATENFTLLKQSELENLLKS